MVLEPMEDLLIDISKIFIRHIVKALDCDMICFINPATYEIEDVPHDFLSGMYYDETWQEALDRVDQWETYITIDRPVSTESVRIMRKFVDECVLCGNLKEQLNNALALRRPDQYFHKIVEKSDYRDQWVTYNRRQMMRHIRQKLRTDIVQKSSLPSVAVC